MFTFSKKYDKVKMFIRKSLNQKNLQTKKGFILNPRYSKKLGGKFNVINSKKYGTSWA